MLKWFSRFFILLIFGCTSNPAPTNTSEISANNSTGQNQEADLDNDNHLNESFRAEFIALYDQPVVVDSSYFIRGKRYRLHFLHYCTKDSSLTVPARYNFDTNTDFQTHQFVSDLTVLAGADTIVSTRISKDTFRPIIDSTELPLGKYGTLLYPSVYFDKNEVRIRYSLSVPVTDLGIPVSIMFDETGRYRIGN